MIQKARFNCSRDLQAVIPDLAPDISEMIASGTVVSTGDSSVYTKEQTIQEVGHYLRDRISIAMAVKRVSASLAGASSVPSGSSPSASQGTSS